MLEGVPSFLRSSGQGWGGEYRRGQGGGEGLAEEEEEEGGGKGGDGEEGGDRKDRMDNQGSIGTGGLTDDICMDDVAEEATAVWSGGEGEGEGDIQDVSEDGRRVGEGALMSYIKEVEIAPLVILLAMVMFGVLTHHFNGQSNSLDT